MLLLVYFLLLLCVSTTLGQSPSTTDVIVSGIPPSTITPNNTDLLPLDGQNTTDAVAINTTYYAAAAATLYSPRGVVNNDPGSYIIMVLLLVAGFAYCFYGFSLFFPTLFLTGYFLASNVVMYALQEARPFLIAGSPTGTRLAYIGIAAGCGVLVGTILVFIWPVGVYVIGLMGGLAVAELICNAVNIPYVVVQVVLFAVLGLTSTVLVYFFERPVIIAGTALAGAYSMVFGADVVANWGLAYDLNTPGAVPGMQSAIEAGIVVVLWLIGMAWQFTQYRGVFGGERREKRQQQQQQQMREL